MLRLRYWLPLILVLLSPVLALMQDDTCPEIVREALAATDKACVETGRNQACYGNINLQAELRAGETKFKFSEPGDIADIAAISSLALKPLDRQANGWGVALLKVQANLPATIPGQNVLFLLFGDVGMSNAVDNSESESALLNPMQAFYFKSGANDAPCADAPSSGIMIQTPEGAGKINLTVNGAEVTLGSTAYIQAQPSADLVINVIEGEGTVSADGVTVAIPAGSLARVPLDANLEASGAPVGPEPYDLAALAALPVDHLQRKITIAPPFEETPEPPSGGAPAAGNWNLVYSVTQDQCGGVAGMAQMVGAQMFRQSIVTFTGTETHSREFYMAVFGQSDASTIPPEISFSDDQQGIFIMDNNITDAQSHLEAHIVSSTQIDGSWVFSGNECVLAYDFTLTRAG
ncbi:MAG: hypothetical protein R3E39_05025 [Anaerolineae bacterium]